MADAPDEGELRRFHRWFAVECNNAAWDLSEKKNRTVQDNEQLLDLAHAAAYHWSQVGTPVNGARAKLLLARAHALAGMTQSALAYAWACLDFCGKEECEDWDLAFAHAEMAHAAAAAGNRALHRQHYAEAKRLGSLIAEEDDRHAFQKEFARIDPPAES